MMSPYQSVLLVITPPCKPGVESSTPGIDAQNIPRHYKTRYFIGSHSVDPERDGALRLSEQMFRFPMLSGTES